MNWIDKNWSSQESVQKRLDAYSNSASFPLPSVAQSPPVSLTLWTFWTCRCTALRSLNWRPHSLQANVTPAWATRWRLRPDTWLKLRLHRWHLCWRSPSRCMRLMCCCKLVFWAKQVSQWGHWWRFAPVCVSMWRLSTSRCENDKSHSSHLYGLRPVWMIIWRFSELAQDNCSWQTGHLSAPPVPFFSVLMCVLRWRDSVFSVANEMGHSWHWNVFRVSLTRPTVGLELRGARFTTKSLFLLLADVRPSLFPFSFDYKSDFG